MKKLFVVISFIANAFFVGIGILLVYVLMEGFFDKFYGLENLFMRFVYLTGLGGISIWGYQSVIKK
jgi:hypothetical protein